MRLPGLTEKKAPKDEPLCNPTLRRQGNEGRMQGREPAKQARNGQPMRQKENQKDLVT